MPVMPGLSSAGFWDLTSGAVSLHPGSTTVYARGHIRDIGSGRVRLQGGHDAVVGSYEEVAGPVSSKLVTYIASLLHSVFSTAGSGTPYVPCLMRKEPGKAGRVRIQIAGPAYNRPWGVEFVIPAASLYYRLPAGKEPTVAENGGGFKIGDKVTIAVRGDADGCGGGPAVGAVGSITSIAVDSFSCGPISVKLESTGVSWATTAKHLIHVLPENVPF